MLKYCGFRPMSLFTQPSQRHGEEPEAKIAFIMRYNTRIALLVRKGGIGEWIEFN